MKRFKKGLLTAVAFLTLCAGNVSAAADPEVQLDTIAAAYEVWSTVLTDLADADSRYMRFAVHDYPTLDIAVTDLDANGRLEVIFRTSRMSGQIVSDAKDFKKPEAYIHAMENIAAIPLGVHATMYQVTEDGTQLEPVTIQEQNKRTAMDFPDLMRLKEPHEISAEMGGARLYRIRTNVHGTPKEYGASLIPFRVLYHTVWLDGDTLCVRLDADKEGHYSVYEEGGIESFVQATYVDGKETPPDVFGQSALLEAFRTYPPVRGAIHWVSCADYDDEDFRADIRTRLAASWYGFSYGIR